MIFEVAAKHDFVPGKRAISICTACVARHVNRQQYLSISFLIKITSIGSKWSQSFRSALVPEEDQTL